jgi:hypothetical protein
MTRMMQRSNEDRHFDSACAPTNGPVSAMSQLVGAVRGDARHDIARRVTALAAELDRPVAAL